MTGHESASLRALFVTSECYPVVKTGGLADVAGALPLALQPLGVDARVLLPAYPGTLERVMHAREVAVLPQLFGGTGTLVEATTADGLRLWLIDAPHLYRRAGGGPYLGPDGHDWPDNHLRFAALSYVGAQLALGEVAGVDGWLPDVVHLHDWQAALTSAYLHFHKRPSPPTLLTIHNLAFQGVFPADVLTSLRLPASAMDVDGMEYWGSLSFLKAGLMWSTRLSTVSPTYAREILTPAEGMGFDGLLRQRANDLSGIANGIDTTVWDPATDPHLVEGYGLRRLAAKTRNKLALQRELGLPVDADAPLFSVVSRLTPQKGVDLLLEALPRLLAREAQLCVLGTGDRDTEAAFHRAAENHPSHVAAVIGYDEALAHRMQAGSDVVVMPSRFEPCGLSQLCGLRYGTLPVVARVIDANEAALHDGVATGFQFSPVEADPLAVAIERACDLHSDRGEWRKVVRRAMTRDVSWRRAAQQYVELYHRLLDGG
jgi:starch synthase